MQFTPSQFIDRYSLLSFSINEETISKDILALISGDIIQHTTSLIDSLALIINPKDEVGLEYTKRFTQMKDSQIYMSNKNPDGEVEYTENKVTAPAETTAESSSDTTTSESTATTAVSSTSKKSHGILIGVIAGIAAAISAVFIANKRKEK